MADPENIKAIVRLRPPLQIVQPLNSSASSPHYVPRQPRLYLHSSTEDSPPPCPYTLQPENASIYAGGSWFTFDGVHSSSTSTYEIYQSHVASMIQDAVRGYNSTLFAYGATGSGKSYSMMGTEKEDGIMQRAIEDVFDLIEQDQEREYVVRASYLEIYNEQLRDLLVSDRPTATQTLPKIHEDRQGRIFVRPLVSTPCGDQDDVMRLLASGESRRRTERTEWNLHSSRSHAIFSLTLESRPVFGPAGFPITSSTMRQVTRQNSRTQLRSEIPSLELSPMSCGDSQTPSSEVFLGTGAGKMPITPSVTRFKSSIASSKSSGHVPDSAKSFGHVPDGSIRISQLNLVDLAGSEKLTDNEARNKEASYIKKSLLALQSVVSSLTELGTSVSSSAQSNQKHRLMHVPYRNSQLTRLLQTSLSGNAKVAFLCTISPDPECEAETLSTLRFAAGAKKVETKAELGQVVDRATLLEALEAKVLELEAALMTNADYTEALERERDEAVERADGAEKICDDYESKLAELQTLRTPLKEQHDHLKRLILTGSPRSSYATQTTLEHHTLIGAVSGTNTLGRKKSTNCKRPSRLSEAATATIAASPTKKVGWKELFFDEQSGDQSNKNNPHQSQHQYDSNGIDKLEDINELNLTIAKLEATLAEAEDTHIGEISELRAEVTDLQNQVDELQNNLKARDDQGGSPNPSDTIRSLEEELGELRQTSDKKIHGLEAELKNQEMRIVDLETKLDASEAAKERLKSESDQTIIEREKQLTLKSHLIATLEQKLRSSASSSKVIAEDLDENGMRRYSEVTMNGEIDKEYNNEAEDDQKHIESVPSSKTKKPSRSRSKSQSNRAKNGKTRSNSTLNHQIDPEEPVSSNNDQQHKEENANGEAHVYEKSLPATMTAGQNRKRTASQRTNNNQNLQDSQSTPHQVSQTDQNLKDKQDQSSLTQESQPVRRSARNTAASKKVLSVVEN